MKRSKKPLAPKAPFAFRKHILPPLMGLLLMGSLLGMFNIEYLVAQGNYRLMPLPQAAATPIVLAPYKQAPQPDPSKPARLSISSINVDAPIVFDEPSVSESKVQLALRRGVVHYGTTAVPGQERGNVVIIGHSSGRPWAPGDYKWVFTLLNKVKVGDEINISYQGLPYVYTVGEISVVEPDDLQVLNQTDRPTLTLITCTPVGTSKQRLVVRAVQTSPSISSKEIQRKRDTTTKQAPVTKPQALPGSDHQSSVWQSVKSWF